MRIFFEIGSLVVFSLFLGTILAGLSLYALFAVGVLGDPLGNHEIFARMVLSVILASLAVYFFVRDPYFTAISHSGLRAGSMFILFAAGISAGLLDPFTYMQDEFNWIRYPTAIALVAAGFVMVRTAMTAPRPMLYRVLGTVLGLLLMVAAAGEILMLHERLDDGGPAIENSATPVASQDLPTLVVALVAIIVALVAVNAIKQLKTRALMGTTDREYLAARLILAAGVTFLAAMLLDTFDYMVSGLARAFLTQGLADTHVLLAGGHIEGFANALSNSAEEVLECGAAVLLFAAATVFAHETLPSSEAVAAE